MEPAAAGPVHLIDRDQVYLVTAGSLTILADGAESRALAGDAVIIPAGATRQIRNQGEIAAVAIVCMTAGGWATLLDGADRGSLPWAAAQPAARCPGPPDQAIRSLKQQKPGIAVKNRRPVTGSPCRWWKV